jgi:hypothetical protein
MAELHPVGGTTQVSVDLLTRVVMSPGTRRRSGGAGPLWRSLLVPRRSQRALLLGNQNSDLFDAFLDAGVHLQGSQAPADPLATPGFDLVLEDRGDSRGRPGSVRIGSLLAAGGRWVVAMERKHCVGLAGWGILRQARREAFATVESFYAHPSLRSPRILVPLDRPAPFRYFLRLAVGVSAPRQRLLALAARCLCALRLHRLLLPNLIVVATKKRET